MAQKAKDAFAEAKKHADPAKSPAMFNLLTGLTLLAEQVEDLQYELRQLKSGVEDLRKR